MKSRKNNLKENPIMDSQKAKKIKKGVNVTTEDDTDIKTFFIILIIIVLLIVAVYFITNVVKKDKTEEKDKETVAGEINYDITSVGTILNRPYDKYYVLVYNSEDNAAVKYSALLQSYMNGQNEKDYIKIYYCDLNNTLNQKYYNVGDDNKSNPKAKKVSDFDFGDLTLLKIEKGKITEYIEDYENIQTKLK